MYFPLLRTHTVLRLDTALACQTRTSYPLIIKLLKRKVLRVDKSLRNQPLGGCPCDIFPLPFLLSSKPTKDLLYTEVDSGIFSIPCQITIAYIYHKDTLWRGAYLLLFRYITILYRHTHLRAINEIRTHPFALARRRTTTVPLAHHRACFSSTSDILHYIFCFVNTFL